MINFNDNSTGSQLLHTPEELPFNFAPGVEPAELINAIANLAEAQS